MTEAATDIVSQPQDQPTSTLPAGPRRDAGGRWLKGVSGNARGTLARADEADHNGLNNRRSNLRRATAPSAFAVCVRERKGDVGKLELTVITWGTFDTPEEAARAYDVAVVERFGEFATTNFPPLPENESPGDEHER